jgi:hypothetical protein
MRDRAECSGRKVSDTYAGRVGEGFVLGDAFEEFGQVAAGELPLEGLGGAVS